MNLKSKLITSTVTICISIVGVFAIHAQSIEVQDLERPTLSNSTIETLKIEPLKDDNINGIVAEQLDWESKNQPPHEEEAREMIEDPVSVEKTDTVEVTPVVTQSSSVREQSFLMNNGTYMTGAAIIDEAMGNTNARKLWDQFNLHFGGEVANKAIISLKFENGTFDSNTVGVCSPVYQINGDYRRCVYSDLNTAGMDAGLKQINTFYQRYRIAKLGGPSCEPVNSRDITDPCTASQVEWLKNVDNNIHMAVDIYAESGFQPWYGAQRAGIV
jgi:hypothetical protein